MTPTNYQQYFSLKKIKEILFHLYKMEAEVHFLHGEYDLNAFVQSDQGDFLLKIFHAESSQDRIDFHEHIHRYLAEKELTVELASVIDNFSGNATSTIVDEAGINWKIQLYTWVEGKLWSEIHPISASLLIDLGYKSGELAEALSGFTHPYSHRYMEWDLARADWIESELEIFEESEGEAITFFLDLYRNQWDKYEKLRKGVIHNDGNDNNLIVGGNYGSLYLKGIIDFGDAVYSQLINNVAITLAYAMMGKADPLRAAVEVVKGYHEKFPLEEGEIPLLYSLIGMRLAVSLTKSTLNQKADPENEYLLVSAKPALELLHTWRNLHPDYVSYSFRNACGFDAHPHYYTFKLWAEKYDTSLRDLFPTVQSEQVHAVDMSIGSTWLQNSALYLDDHWKSFQIQQLQQAHPGKIVAGGYLETRPFYSTKAFEKEGNNGPEYRTVHLGVDFWLPAETPVHAIWPGKVYSTAFNDFHKDYGATLILAHQTETGIPFYSLYGHLSKRSLELWQKGDEVSKGDLIAWLGNYEENGHWTPHLHFQIMLDMLGNEANFPGVGFPDEIGIWKELCPDPNLFFNLPALASDGSISSTNLLSRRKKYVGRGMSISYQKPLTILRGQAAYLIDSNGRRYLDTANNVAHVGHEHPRVVEAGARQMRVLNTNTRYLHPALLDFSEELLSTLPSELSVVHVVNSGSEANDLAMRMARACSGQEDFIAIELGYHGHTEQTIGVSSYKFDSKGGKGKPAHTQLLPLPDPFRGKYRGEESASAYASHIQEAITQIMAEGRNPAGFIGESILSCGGQIEPPQGYLKEIYQKVRAAGGICIADEVQTGVGRVGKYFWAFELQAVVPDIVTIGKPIGNGHPLAVVVCTEEVADAFNNGMEYFNTFGGNPVSATIGLEVLRVVKDEALQKHAYIVGEYLKQEFRSLQEEFPIIADVRGQGLFLGVEFTDEHLTPLAQQTSYLSNRMRELGILLSTDGPDHNVIKIKPPLVFNLSHADELLSRTRQILKEDGMKV
ncbi:MAG: aminotransferase class III-fold pyridoxal phosphate-dependent enzyme [Bacteroidota bacterium]